MLIEPIVREPYHAEACATATAAGDKETLAAQKAEINALVHQLFHLTPAEIALIEGT